MSSISCTEISINGQVWPINYENNRYLRYKVNEGLIWDTVNTFIENDTSESIKDNYHMVLNNNLGSGSLSNPVNLLPVTNDYLRAGLGSRTGGSDNSGTGLTYSPRGQITLGLKESDTNNSSNSFGSTLTDHLSLTHREVTIIGKKEYLRYPIFGEPDYTRSLFTSSKLDLNGLKLMENGEWIKYEDSSLLFTNKSIKDPIINGDLIFPRNDTNISIGGINHIPKLDKKKEGIFRSHKNLSIGSEVEDNYYNNWEIETTNNNITENHIIEEYTVGYNKIYCQMNGDYVLKDNTETTFHKTNDYYCGWTLSRNNNGTISDFTIIRQDDYTSIPTGTTVSSYTTNTITLSTNLIGTIRSGTTIILRPSSGSDKYYITEGETSSGTNIVTLTSLSPNVTASENNNTVLIKSIITRSFEPVSADRVYKKNSISEDDNTYSSLSISGTIDIYLSTQNPRSIEGILYGERIGTMGSNKALSIEHKESDGFYIGWGIYSWHTVLYLDKPLNHVQFTNASIELRNIYTGDTVSLTSSGTVNRGSKKIVLASIPSDFLDNYKVDKINGTSLSIDVRVKVPYGIIQGYNSTTRKVQNTFNISEYDPSLNSRYILKPNQTLSNNPILYNDYYKNWTISLEDDGTLVTNNSEPSDYLITKYKYEEETSSSNPLEGISGTLAFGSLNLNEGTMDNYPNSTSRKYALSSLGMDIIANYFEDWTIAISTGTLAPQNITDINTAGFYKGKITASGASSVWDNDNQISSIDTEKKEVTLENAIPSSAIISTLSNIVFINNTTGVETTYQTRNPPSFQPSTTVSEIKSLRFDDGAGLPSNGDSTQLILSDQPGDSIIEVNTRIYFYLTSSGRSGTYFFYDMPVQETIGSDKSIVLARGASGGGSGVKRPQHINVTMNDGTTSTLSNAAFSNYNNSTSTCTLKDLIVVADIMGNHTQNNFNKKIRLSSVDGLSSGHYVKYYNDIDNITIDWDNTVPTNINTSTKYYLTYNNSIWKDTIYKEKIYKTISGELNYHSNNNFIGENSNDMDTYKNKGILKTLTHSVSNYTTSTNKVELIGTNDNNPPSPLDNHYNQWTILIFFNSGGNLERHTREIQYYNGTLKQAIFNEDIPYDSNHYAPYILLKKIVSPPYKKYLSTNTTVSSYNSSEKKITLSTNTLNSIPALTKLTINDATNGNLIETISIKDDVNANANSITLIRSPSVTLTTNHIITINNDRKYKLSLNKYQGKMSGKHKLSEISSNVNDFYKGWTIISSDHLSIRKVTTITGYNGIDKSITGFANGDTTGLISVTYMLIPSKNIKYGGNGVISTGNTTGYKLISPYKYIEDTLIEEGVMTTLNTLSAESSLEDNYYNGWDIIVYRDIPIIINYKINNGSLINTTIFLNSGNYSEAELGTELQYQLNRIDTNYSTSWTVTYDSSTIGTKYTITASSPITFSIQWLDTQTTYKCNSYLLFGFNNTNNTNFVSSVTSNNTGFDNRYLFPYIIPHSESSKVDKYYKNERLIITNPFRRHSNTKAITNNLIDRTRYQLIPPKYTRGVLDIDSTIKLEENNCILKDDYYNGWIIITICNGLKQFSYITDYVSSSRTVTAPSLNINSLIKKETKYLLSKGIHSSGFMRTTRPTTVPTEGKGSIHISGLENSNNTSSTVSEISIELEGSFLSTIKDYYRGWTISIYISGDIYNTRILGYDIPSNNRSKVKLEYLNHNLLLNINGINSGLTFEYILYKPQVLQLSYDAIPIDNFYKGWTINVMENGRSQTSLITYYNGSTREINAPNLTNITNSKTRYELTEHTEDIMDGALTLSSRASDINNYYKGWYISILSPSDKSIMPNTTKLITGYSATDKKITILNGELSGTSSTTHYKLFYNSNNTSIGNNSGVNNRSGFRNICIGNNAGSTGDGDSDKLYISSDTIAKGENSFIYGDMSKGSEKLTVNGNLRINGTDANPNSITFPNSRGADGQTFVLGSNGILGWGSGGSGGSYTLPEATNSQLGGIIVGSGLSVAGDGTLSTSGGSGSTSLIGIWSSGANQYYAYSRSITTTSSIVVSYDSRSINHGNFVSTSGEVGWSKTFYGTSTSIWSNSSSHYRYGIPFTVPTGNNKVCFEWSTFVSGSINNNYFAEFILSGQKTSFSAAESSANGGVSMSGATRYSKIFQFHGATTPGQRQTLTIPSDIFSVGSGNHYTLWITCKSANNGGGLLYGYGHHLSGTTTTYAGYGRQIVKIFSWS